MSDDSEVERIPNSEKAPTHRFPDDMPTGAELKGAVPLDQLRELADEWKKQADREAAPEQWALNKCTKELREVMEEYD